MMNRIEMSQRRSQQQKKKKKKIFILEELLALFHDAESAEDEMLEADLYLERSVTVCQTIRSDQSLSPVRLFETP